VEEHERRYYDRRAPEYDDWYLGSGRFADADRPGWAAETGRLTELLAGLGPGRILDVACGTGFLTRHLRGEVTGVDQSAAMLAIARERAPGARFVEADAFALPFADASFDLVLTAHFYGHLGDGARGRFLDEARRVAPRLVVVDAAVRPGLPDEEVAERVLSDGSRHAVYKRRFLPEALGDELGGGEVVFAGEWFVAVAA
jgi:ubiquinone/menaquinone biosynthesis C-methylase UbiE